MTEYFEVKVGDFIESIPTGSIWEVLEMGNNLQKFRAVRADKHYPVGFTVNMPHLNRKLWRRVSDADSGVFNTEVSDGCW